MSRSIFDLKTNASELTSSNSGMSGLGYDQIATTRNVVGDAFPQGSIHLQWTTGGTKWSQPSKSYLRMRCKLTKQDGTQLVVSDGIAPNMNLVAGLFQSAEIRVNDKTVGRVSDFVPQVDTIENRMSKSSSWLDSIGNSTNFWNESFEERQASVCSDGKSEEKEIVTTKLGMGFDPTTTLALADTGILTQATATVAWNTGIFVVGDEIEITAAIGPIKYQIVAINSATTMTLAGLGTADNGVFTTAVVPFSRIRKSNEARNVSEFELTWVPPLNLFKYMGALPPGLKFELILTPQTNTVYQKYAIESVLSGADQVPNLLSTGTPTAGSTFKFAVVDMFLYVNTVEGPRFDNGSFLLDLEQTRCQSQKIDATNLSQKQFDVAQSTYALTIAYDDIRSGTDTRISSTKMKLFKKVLTDTTPTSQELKLTRFYYQYAGRQSPQPDSDPKFDSTIDRTTQRYLETQLYSGQYFNSGGTETIEKYHDRGSYYHFMTPKDAGDRSTRVVLNQEFTGLTNDDKEFLRVLLFDSSRSVARITISDGVVEVNVQEI